MGHNVEDLASFSYEMSDLFKYEISDMKLKLLRHRVRFAFGADYIVHIISAQGTAINKSWVQIELAMKA